MSAAGFIGRVGGLALALGVGAAAFNGAAVAWADSSGSGGSSAHAGSARSASGDSTSAGGPAKHTAPGAVAASGRSRPTSTVRAQSTVGTLTKVASTPAAAAEPSEPETPAVPAESPLELAALAYSRRDTGVSARPAAAASLVPEASVQALAAQNTALIMGPSGVPIPSPTYIQDVFNLYVAPNSPAGTVPFQLDTPEGLYPITGVKSLPLNVSVDQGLQILAAAIAEQVAAGNTATVFGYSQSAIISSLIMSQLPADTPVEFVLVGNEMNPNGGLLSRFPGLQLPSLGLNFYGATPENLFPTTNYTQEYDGFADFPRYPLNILSVLNAGLGIIFVHTKYADLTQEQVDSAIALPTTSATQHYYIIPTQNLPLLEPLRLLPVIGTPLADLLQPALKVIVNLGYGDPQYGWSNEGFANQQTTFGIIPDVNWGEVANLFFAGVEQGIKDFVADVSPGGVMWQELASLKLPEPSSLAPPPTPASIITALQTVITDTALFISNAAASLYAALLPTADIVNAIVTVLPAYDATLFLDGIQQAISGDVINGLINAIGLPIAANAGLVTTAALIEVLVLLQAVEGFFGQQTNV
ncbi:PE-PPE domain-containing protein [Mycobacterium sp. CVI_P3]|uniref:PE-PPE domain-containing protein n=1 Tax=Mycobacterium pinniadriaticum TaxID=2994102 RepID=A0ABT3S7E6_9MYCO|nr:PE-PPE domain-containing protein [Mycobacterium pinniadriaticum]MCX2928713.1 PE-PPE domain-containing protein [Mycobacterium pinniadriaticum]MCX2935420.1 PE-PPE domain-containing protein [Mycobacterium pinniadriaticum]